MTNCILIKDQHILTLKKPRRGWCVAPGGKMEPGESIRESVTREFWEETGIRIKDPGLRSVFTILVEENGEIIDEWMLFTFQATESEGTLLKKSPEGILSWHPLEMIPELPMAEGDYLIFDQVLKHKKIVYGTFKYTKDYSLLSYRFEVDGELKKEYTAGN